MANDIVQTIAEARVDARSLSEFVFKPAGFKVARRLAPPIDTLQFYIDRFDATKATTDVYIATIPTIVNDAINNTAVEGGVLADTFVTVTARGAETIARTQRAKNSDSITPYDFGAKGGFNTDTLASRFATLADAQAVYPNAVSLTELADRVAFDAFLSYLIKNSVPIANWGCEICIDQPLVSYTNAKTTSIAGDLYIQGVKKYISHALHIATKSFTFTGTIFVNSKTTNSLPNRELVHGVVMGAGSSLGLPKLAGSADNGTFGNVVGRGLLGFAFVGGQNAHFARVNTVRGATCGSALYNAGTSFTQGIWEDFTSMTVSGSNVNQRAVLKFSSSNMTPEMLAALGGHQFMTATINGKPYDILGLDLTAKEITVYPAPPPDEQGTGGYIMYHFGGAVHMGTDSGNNTSATSFGTIQAIVCGIGLDMRTLYGASISVLSTEFCGAGCVVGNRSAAHIGTKINLGYFEANSSDILLMWNSSDRFHLSQTIALNMNKVWQMFGYTMPDGTRRDSWSHIYGARIGEFYVERAVLELNSRHSNPVLVVSGDTTRIFPLTLNSKFAELQFIKDKSIRVVLLNSKAELQFDAPEGFTINNGTSVILNAGDFDTHIDLFTSWNVSTKAITLTVITNPKGKALPSGNTESRPLNPQVGSEYFDTTISKPIYYDGTQWVDAIGEVV